MSVIVGPTGGSPGDDVGHGLLVSGSVREQRRGAATWVQRRLADGVKVYYTARPHSWGDGDARWLTGPDGAGGTERALATGQLEILDLLEVAGLTGGTTEGLHRLQADEIVRGLGEGWPGIAMSRESSSHPMADDGAVAEFVAREAGYEALGERWPLSTLCQLTLPHETPVAVWESAALHHGRLLDGQWSASWVDHRWRVRGELDVHVVDRFGAALHGALRWCLGRGGDPDLHVDVAGAVLDLGCAQSLMVTAHVVSRRQTIVLHGAGPPLREVLAAVGRPRTLRYAEDGS